MKIGLNGRFLCHPYTGIGQYTHHLLTAMASEDGRAEWVVATPEKLNPKKIKLPKNVSLIVVPQKKLPTASLRNWFWEQFQVPRIFKKENVDIAHYPYPSNPRFTRSSAAKTVVTVHDVIPWTHREYQKRLRTRLYQKNAKKALKKADHIIAVSQTTAFALSDQIQFPFSRMSIIHEAPGPDFSVNTRKHRYENPSFIYVGGYDKRKNVLRLVEAYQEYIAPQYKVDLILVGAKDQQNPHYTELKSLYKSMESRKIKNLQRKLRGRIRTTGYLPAETLATYYRAALGFVNVSLAEGFNIPLLEAAACGTPIITSDIAIHREIIGNNGLFCDPLNTKNIGETLLNFLRDSDQQNKLREDSLALSKEYSWKRAAEETLNLYRNLV